MDLSFSPAEELFRAEVPRVARGERAEPRRCRRATPREGFGLHLEWERTLFDAR